MYASDTRSWSDKVKDTLRGYRRTKVDASVSVIEQEPGPQTRGSTADEEPRKSPEELAKQRTKSADIIPHASTGKSTEVVQKQKSLPIETASIKRAEQSTAVKSEQRPLLTKTFSAPPASPNTQASPVSPWRYRSDLTFSLGEAEYLLQSLGEVTLSSSVPSDLYEPLHDNTHGHSQIRLFRLLPGQKHEDIAGELFSVSFWDIHEEGRHDSLPGRGTRHQRTHYEALSYTWGGSEDVRYITVNKRPLAVTKNLHIALRHLRRTSTEVVLWIDAICINQSDVGERSRQVELMRAIFASADRVLVWLGEAYTPAGDETEAKQGLQELQTILNTLTSSPDGEVFEAVFDRAFTPSLINILSRPWWSRLWTIQEGAVARDVCFCIGSESSGLLEAQVPSRMAASLSSEHALVHLLTTKAVQSQHSSAEARQLKRFIKHRIDLSSYYLSTLVELVSMYLDRDCSDPRDRIFALLGLAEDKHDLALNAADYNLSLEEVLLRFACGFHRGPLSASLARVPDQRRMEDICRRLARCSISARACRASAGVPLEIYWTRTVEKTLGRGAKGTGGGGGHKWIHPTLPGIFVDEIVTDAAHDERDEEVRNGFERLYFLSPEYQRFKAVRPSDVADAGWRGTVTKQKRVAAAPKAARKGDRVFVVIGMPVPFVVREGWCEGAKKAGWDVLGECYLEGVMGGETLVVDGASEVPAHEEEEKVWQAGRLRGQGKGRAAGVDSVYLVPRAEEKGDGVVHVKAAPGYRVSEIVLGRWIGGKG